MYPTNLISIHQFLLTSDVINHTNSNSNINTNGFVNALIRFYFKANYEMNQIFGKLTPTQQAIFSIIIILMIMIIISLFIAAIVNLFGGRKQLPDSERRLDYDLEIKHQIAARKQAVAEENRDRNHHPFKSKIAEFLYQLFK